MDLFAANTANGYKAALTLEEFGQDYTIHTIDLIKGEQFSDAFKAVSPVGRIPAIRDGDISVYGTEAIALYMADKHGRFLPTTQPDRARVFEMAAFAGSDLATPLAVQFQTTALIEGDHPAVADYFTAQARRMFETLNTMIAWHGYAGCAEYTIADMLAFPVAEISASRIPGLLDKLEALAEWQAAIRARPAVQAALARKLG